MTPFIKAVLALEAAEAHERVCNKAQKEHGSPERREARDDARRAVREARATYRSFPKRHWRVTDAEGERMVTDAPTAEEAITSCRMSTHHKVVWADPLTATELV